ncbi:uncharacterized protein [Diabrotica undecimpunctata]|uniref:uncharacterized protein n=1 Tax=Diabrotica undecimpunctata TaxID=50387 RepID=UPI003B63897C
MEHNRLLHCGPQQILSTVRENFWVLGGRNLARKVYCSCVRCFRCKPIPLEQIMGVLPKDRVEVNPPFYVTGTDYAGPFPMKTKRGRGSQIIKCYICLFVCFSTKALHLEVVSDLTSEAWIACFRRFVARRDKPLKIYSDNGSNYIGANTELKELQKFLELESQTISNTLGNEGIQWQFIPARAPNFGGLWEAAVKSCKHHLRRILVNSPLTYEEFITLLAQVEAVLNSRPLVPLSSSPDDLEVLTPSHFLIGRKLTAAPDPSLQEIPVNHLSRWQHVQMLHQHFWSRWSSEYLAGLQQGQKWLKNSNNLQTGQLVIIKEDNLPPSQWRLGRVKELFCGPDGNNQIDETPTNQPSTSPANSERDGGGNKSVKRKLDYQNNTGTSNKKHFDAAQ